VHCVWFYIIISKDKERFIYFFPLTIFSKCIAFHSYWVCIHWNEMYKTKCNRCASVSIHQKWNIQNQATTKEKHVGKKVIYSYTRTLIGQKNFPNLRLTDKTFFLANTLQTYTCTVYSVQYTVAYTLYTRLGNTVVEWIDFEQLENVSYVCYD
jgi:hypothetical protein